MSQSRIRRQKESHFLWVVASASLSHLVLSVSLAFLLLDARLNILYHRIEWTDQTWLCFLTWLIDSNDDQDGKSDLQLMVEFVNGPSGGSLKSLQQMN